MLEFCEINVISKLQNIQTTVNEYILKYILKSIGGTFSFNFKFLSSIVMLTSRVNKNYAFIYIVHLIVNYVNMLNMDS